MKPVTIAGLVAGALLGALALVGARFFFQPDPESIHYHANWAIFVEGQRVDLSADRYMEDVMQCSVDPSLQRPEDRIHMHAPNPGVVHVHSSGTTWGHLLANIGFGAGDDYLEVEDSIFREDGTRSLKFVLDGRAVRTIRNLPVRDQSRLLISFGPETVEEVIATQFPQVDSTAARYNEMADPASCAGAAKETAGERLRRAVGL